MTQKSLVVLWVLLAFTLVPSSAFGCGDRWSVRDYWCGCEWVQIGICQGAGDVCEIAARPFACCGTRQILVPSSCWNTVLPPQTSKPLSDEEPLLMARSLSFGGKCAGADRERFRDWLDARLNQSAEE